MKQQVKSMRSHCFCIYKSHLASHICFINHQKIDKKSCRRMMMMGSSVEQSLNQSPDNIQKAYSLAMEAHGSVSNKLFVVSEGQGVVFLSFGGAWSVANWYVRGPFGETKVNQRLFPSMRRVGMGEVAKVNEAFQMRFEAISRNADFLEEVDKAERKRKAMVFTGHSSGAAIAVLATIWLLEKRLKRENNLSPVPICLTFGSPLIGDKIFHHALQRQNWSGSFTNFVMKRDIVPRILLAPLTSVEQQLQPVLKFLLNSRIHRSDNAPAESSEFCASVIRNAASVASHAASKLMDCTNMLLETMTNFVLLSPYWPFGTYVFLSENEKPVMLKNPDAILQLLFYSCQLERGTNACDSSYLKEHIAYESALGRNLQSSVVNLDSLEIIPLSTGGVSGDVQVINTALNDLGVSTRGRICLLAAVELKKRKKRNEASINQKKDKIIEYMEKLEEYKGGCEFHEVCYYDSFKLSREEKDFKANVHRLELAGRWDEIIEMLKKYELPDDFEGQNSWIELGTRFRRLMEPLDIANYYRHTKNEDTGPYLGKGRPRRYKFTQKWLEQLTGKASSESCFWADVEELCLIGNKGDQHETRKKVLELEANLNEWIQKGEIGNDVFWPNSTFVKWWSTLSEAHRATSPISQHIIQTR